LRRPATGGFFLLHANSRSRADGADTGNSDVPTNVDMKLTGHKTAAMFMHYVHAKSRRQAITGASRSMELAA
jgi:hypothetical protein